MKALFLSTNHRPLISSQLPFGMRDALSATWLIDYAVVLALCTLLVLVGPGHALADSVTGSLEGNYSFFTFKTTDDAGNTVKREGNAYLSRFNLNIEKEIFPNLKLSGGGIFEGTYSDVKTNDERTKTLFTRMSPFVDLTLTTPLYTAGVRYDRREDRIDTSGASVQAGVNQEYSGILGWRPEGLPSAELRYIRTNTFDKDRSVLDIDKDFVSLLSRYRYKGFTADYYGAFTQTQNNIIDLKTKDLMNSGKFTYTGNFFKDRVSLNTTYNISHQEVRVASEGAGFVTSQVFPFAGLSIISDTTDPIITLNPTPALVDGNTAASAGIDLVSPPPLVRRQIGLDFVAPVVVNQLLVWVDRELTSTEASAFSWNIYVSSDNVTWSYHAGPFTAPFGPFRNCFEINFPTTPASRYIKVVTVPLLLSPVVPPNILVTELQAFTRTPAADVQGKTKRTSHIYTLDTRTRILDSPGLYHELSYFYTTLRPSGQTRYTLSNGLSANHRFSRVFSGSARVAREDGKEEDEKRVAYVYTASIDATPLRTLRNSLVFSGRNEEIEGESSSNYTVFLNNTAELYKGIDVNLIGGVTFSEQPTGERQRDTIINLITTIVPRRDLTFNLSYLDTITKRSGGEGSSDDHTRRVELALTYTPFNTLYLTASLEVIAQVGEKVKTTQNYGLNWSPFPDGALQFMLFYNEAIRSEDQSKSRIVVPRVRWNFTKASYFEVVFQWIKNEYNTGESDGKVIGTNLKLFF